jgi:hypothetical protein
MRALLYVLIKPPHMSEREALEDSCETVRQAFAMGADSVSVEAMAVQVGTPLTELYERGEFTPPWLWTVVEVVRRTHFLGELRVGGNVVVPPPIKVAENCPSCSDRVREALRVFDETQNIAVLDVLNCDCRAVWESEINPIAHLM